MKVAKVPRISLSIHHEAPRHAPIQMYWERLPSVPYQLQDGTYLLISLLCTLPSAFIMLSYLQHTYQKAPNVHQ